jgi:hypothetical protein
MKPTESPYEIVVGRGSHRNPLGRRRLIALAATTLMAFIAIAVMNGSAVPRPKWIVLPATVAVLWLAIAYLIVWQDVMLRVYRRLAPLDVTDRARFAVWLAVLFAIAIGTLGWVAAFIVVAGHPS